MAVARRSPARGDVHLVRLDPTAGSEIRKTRPCLIISPDELNQHLRTAIVAPMTQRANLSVTHSVPFSEEPTGERGPRSDSYGRHRAAGSSAWAVVVRDDGGSAADVAGDVRPVGVSKRDASAKSRRAPISWYASHRSPVWGSIVNSKTSQGASPRLSPIRRSPDVERTRVFSGRRLGRQWAAAANRRQRLEP